MNRLFTNLLLIMFLFLLVSSGFTQATYDTLSIYDLQYVPDPSSDDLSAYLGDTVVVKGMVMNGPRDLWIGARWGIYIVDPDSFPNPWSGFFIVQQDTMQVNTNVGFLEPGMICYFTGLVDEFGSFSQLSVYGFNFIPDEVIPVTIVSSGNELPEPLLLTADNLKDLASGEQWESMWIRVENATIISNSIAGNWASAIDATGETTYLAEYFLWFYNRLPGSYSWPVPGTNFNVNGFTRDESGSPGRVYTINPRDTSDIETLTLPPVFEYLSQKPQLPTSSDDVEVQAVITDDLGVDTVILYYRVDFGPYFDLGFTKDTDADTFRAVVPKQVDNSFVSGYIFAKDLEGNERILPGDTSSTLAGWHVRDSGLSIRDVQYTYGYSDDASLYANTNDPVLVTLRGVVMNDSTDFSGGDIYIQEADTAWAGIWVNDPPVPQVAGDLVEVTGFVEEDFSITRLNNITKVEVITPGGVAFDPVMVKTGDITTGGPDGEAYESVLIQFDDVTVINPFPDAAGNFGEFTIDDGSGEIRVDDRASAYRGNLDSLYMPDDVIEKIIGFGYYSFSDYKLIPRDSNDVIGHVSQVEKISNRLPFSYTLEQNYPNPFNPVTQIEYTIAKSGTYDLLIYNALGQKVIILASQSHSPGSYRINWNGVDQNGFKVGSGMYFYVLQGENMRIAKKMLLIK